MKFFVYAWLAIQVALSGVTNRSINSIAADVAHSPATHAQYLNPDPFLPKCILPKSLESAVQQVYSTITQIKHRQINPVEFYSNRKEAVSTFQESYFQLCRSLIRSQEISIMLFPFNYFW